MITQDYIDRNMQGFEGDTILLHTVKDIIKKNGIKTVIETGTYLGGTTKQFAKMVKNVKTIEVNLDFFMKAQKNLMGTNVNLIYGSSIDNLPYLLKDNKTLLWLDAHWQHHCPLLEELKGIADSGIKPYIAIHDFKVPNSDFGYDSYNGQDFTWEWIEPAIRTIYGNSFGYFYNEQAEGARRGVIFIYPVEK